LQDQVAQAYTLPTVERDLIDKVLTTVKKVKLYPTENTVPIEGVEQHVNADMNSITVTMSTEELYQGNFGKA
jgi:hypothetical protein